MVEAKSFVELGPTEDKFISYEPDGMGNEKTANKLGLSIRKSNKKIKTVNSEEAPTVGVSRNVELQIGKWKYKKDFEIVLFPWGDEIQLVEDVLDGANINSTERNATKAPSEKLVEHEFDMRPVELTIETTPLGKQDRWGSFKVFKQGGRGTVGGTKPRCENRGDFNWNKLEWGQVRAVTFCQQNVPTSAIVQVKRQRKPR
ncbi:hypothetical protein J1N35_000966 [Gossypium stocksii]|uniref:Uncharacterized protein n=1 Tax=Gossypium stocksii TaxID=47602 RepID=A0A9D4AL89_9ROSI|nr:hypothetical protein J1N35_000966 [Gossypium stocksii]